ncbi:hypothetical protein IAT40_004942 [Kwoniella sp. CBS 6097]
MSLITSPTSLIPPIPTSTITPLHNYEKRHVYLCGDETVSWRPEWYTASFFVSSRVSYDSAASRGPVQPPTRVYQEVPECAAILSRMVASASSDVTVITATESWSSTSSDTRSGFENESESESEGTATVTPAIVVTTTAAVQSTFTSGGSTFATTVQRILTLTPTASATPSPDPSETAISSQNSSTPNGSSATSASGAEPTATESTLPSINDNTCARGWD